MLQKNEKSNKELQGKHKELHKKVGQHRKQAVTWPVISIKAL